MANKWTKEQESAIYTRGNNVLVSAAAGSGKTAVLVERIINIILNENNPIDIDRLLVVTFTKAAASEMKQRIGEAISKKLQACIENNEDCTNIRKQMTLLGKSNIVTLHSFCMSVVRKNFHILGIEPDFKIMDGLEGELIKEELIETLFENKYSIAQGDTASEDDKVFLELIECYGGKIEDIGLKEMIFEIYDFVQGSPYIEKWLLEKSEMFNIENKEEFEQNIWVGLIREHIKLEIESCIDLAKRAAIMAADGENPNYVQTFTEDISDLEELFDLVDISWEKLCQKFVDFKFRKLKNATKLCDEGLKEECKDIRDKEIKKKIEKLKADIFFRNSEEMITDLNNQYPRIKKLSELTLEFGNMYRQKKQEKALLDFNDLEQYTLKILMEENSTPKNIIPSQIATEYRKFFEEILVDEYQDTNLVQDTIVNLISRQKCSDTIGVPNLFMVGDVKQSIYKFRLAEPKLFIEKYKLFEDVRNLDKSNLNASGLNADNINKKGIKIDLHKNFRSRKEVLDGTNFIFKQIMSYSLGDVEYDDNAALYTGANYKDINENEEIEQNVSTGGPIELNIIGPSMYEKNEEMDSEELEELMELDKVQIEARFIAKRINELKSDKDKVFKVFDKEINDYRKVKYKDIVILLRATSNYSSVFLEELLNVGIPAFSDTGGGYFDAIEIKTALSLLKIIDNPMQDIPLITILRSPIIKLSADEISKIRIADKEGSFYQALIKFTEVPHEESTENLLCEKLKEFIDKLVYLRERSAMLSTDELLWTIYTETDYYTYVGAMPGGKQRQANLRMLFDKAKEFERSSAKGLFNFVRFIEKIKKTSSGDMDAAKVLGENEDVVRIMSIHKSKGLEFPIVFLAGIAKQFNMMDMRKSLMLHNELGFGSMYIDIDKRIKYDTVSKIAVKYKTYTEIISEEMRILYVALTRAKEKLILVGTERGIAKNAKKWCAFSEYKGNSLPLFAVKNARSYLDWICMAVARHRDGEKIRELVNNKVFISSNLLSESINIDKDTNVSDSVRDESKWEVMIWESSDFLTQKEEKEVREDIKEKFYRFNANLIYGKENTREIIKRLSWKYEYSRSTKLPTKTSVSEIKNRYLEYIARLENEAENLYSNDYNTELQNHEILKGIENAQSAGEDAINIDSIINLDFLANNDSMRNSDIENQDNTIVAESLVNSIKANPIVVPKPKFLQEEVFLSGQERGILMHFVMRHIDFSKKTFQDVNEQLEEMITKELLTREQKSYININKIVKFLNSDLGLRLANSDESYREIPFVLVMNENEIYYTDVPKPANVLVQGVIDCYFIENETLVLLDYKTDYVKTQEDIDKIKKKYELQVNIYERAIREIYKTYKTEKYLYLFSADMVVSYK